MWAASSARTSGPFRRGVDVAAALPVACGSSYACASGAVTVGSLGHGGGFAGQNGGIISYAFATGVTGRSGPHQ